MSRCVNTAPHFRPLLLPPSLPYFHLFFSPEKASASHGWEICVKHTPQHVHCSQRSDKLTTKTFCDAWRVNSICLIFSHRRSYELYSRHTEYKKPLHPYDCPLYIIHQTLLFCSFLKCFLSGTNLKVKCWIVRINVSESHENDLL